MLICPYSKLPYYPKGTSCLSISLTGICHGLRVYKWLRLWVVGADWRGELTQGSQSAGAAVPLGFVFHSHLKLFRYPLWIDALAADMTKVIGFRIVQDFAAGYIEDCLTLIEF